MDPLRATNRERQVFRLFRLNFFLRLRDIARLLNFSHSTIGKILLRNRIHAFYPHHIYLIREASLGG